MEPDVGVISELLRIFEEAFRGGYLDVQGYAFSLLGVLVAIELTFLGLWCALGGSEVAGPFLKKLLAIGFFSWVVMQFDWLTTEVIAGFTAVGRTAAGAAGGDTRAITDPSYVISEGFRVTKALFDYARQTNEASWVGLAADSIIAILGAIFILIAFFLIALQIFITRVEFAMLVALGLILIPFGIFKHTAFLAEKTFGAIISFGIKLMVLTFIVSVAMPLLTRYTIPENPSWDTIFNMAFVAATIMYLAWHAPSVTAGLLTGGPSLSGIGLASPIAAAGGAAVGAAGAIGAAALKGAATGGASAAISAVKAAAGAIGGGASSAGPKDGGGGASTGASAQVNGGVSAASSGGGAGSGSSGSLQTARSVKGGGGRQGEAPSSGGGSTYTSGSEAKSSLTSSRSGDASGSNQEKQAGGPQTNGQDRKGGATQGASGANPGTEAGAKAGFVEEPQNSQDGGNSDGKTPISKGTQRNSRLNERIRHSAHRGKEAAKEMVEKAPNPVVGLSLSTLKE